MRAMLMSFASYHLWLHWRKPALHLAKLFTDYEPGIHYSQVQMQSGTTGINAIRIYNPIKQSLEKDSEGVFIKKWVPELRSLPKELVHRPWDLTLLEEAMYDFKIGRDYPKPIVNIEDSGAHAREKLWSIKNSNKSKKNGLRILAKHSKARNKKRLGRG